MLDNDSQERGWFYASAWNSRRQPATQDFPRVTGLPYSLSLSFSPITEARSFLLNLRGNSPGVVSPRGSTAAAAAQQRNFRRAEKKTFSAKRSLRGGLNKRGGPIVLAIYCRNHQLVVLAFLERSDHDSARKFKFYAAQ